MTPPTMIAASYGLMSVGPLIVAALPTGLEVVVLTTVSPVDPGRVVQILLLIAVVPVLWAILIWRAAARVGS